jgi:hypothetical protein
VAWRQLAEVHALAAQRAGDVVTDLWRDAFALERLDERIAASQIDGAHPRRRRVGLDVERRHGGHGGVTGEVAGLEESGSDDELDA